MIRPILYACPLALAACLLPAGLAAQEATPAAAPANVREPAAMAALAKMGQSMRRLTSFSLHADVTSEEVLESGQKIQSGGTVDYKIRRPNAFRIDMVSDEVARTIFYNGKQVTVFAPRLGYYASFESAPTIGETLKKAQDQFSLQMPLVDLFDWGNDPEVMGRIKSAMYAGTETVNGLKCEQYAMRQDAVDWQIWLRQGPDALPCKIVITTTEDPSQPQYSAVFTWHTKAAFADSTFAFAPPQKAQHIKFGMAGPDRNHPEP